MPGLSRVIDANTNRAREALRTLEDVARFTLASEPLAAGLKAARHDLRTALEAAGLDPLLLAAGRDTPGDVGTDLTGTGEASRGDAQGLAVAAGKRAGEALRVLEEALKTLPASSGQANPGRAARAPWALVKDLRYRVYDLEQRVALALGTGRGTQWRLCVLISQSLCKRPWLDVARAAIAGGADCLQLREKELGGTELLRRACALMDLAREGARHGDRPRRTTEGHDTRPPRATVIINDRADVALAAGADGVHLGQHDLPVRAVRALAGARLLVGVSTHDAAEAARAAADGADYCGVGAMFATATKPREVSGAAYLRAYLSNPETARIPHLAIGGVAPENIRHLVAVGCRGVAVSGVVCGGADPERVCRELIAALNRDKPG